MKDTTIGKREIVHDRIHFAIHKFLTKINDFSILGF
jgi:hypothetical protein